MIPGFLPPCPTLHDICLLLDVSDASFHLSATCVQVSRLESTPGLRTVANLPVINGLITSFMPSVILRIFLALLPNLLAFMSHLQGMTSLSQIDFGVMRKYFIFQVSPYCPWLALSSQIFVVSS